MSFLDAIKVFMRRIYLKIHIELRSESWAVEE
jgi:hypothetical protein